MIARAASSGEKLDIRGGGSKAAIGWPDRAAAILDMTGFSGILDYDPAELVITLGAGTSKRTAKRTSPALCGTCRGFPRASEGRRSASATARQDAPSSGPIQLRAPVPQMRLPTKRE